jgi:hypothetical protein
MDIEDDDATRALEERSRIAAEVLERSLLRALGNVEAELARVVRTGEADLERLAVLFIDTLTKLAGASGSGGDGGTSGSQAGVSANQLAAAITRMARRGARFS